MTAKRLAYKYNMIGWQSIVQFTVDCFVSDVHDRLERDVTDVQT